MNYGENEIIDIWKMKCGLKDWMNKNRAVFEIMPNDVYFQAGHLHNKITAQILCVRQAQRSFKYNDLVQRIKTKGDQLIKAVEEHRISRLEMKELRKEFYRLQMLASIYDVMMPQRYETYMKWLDKAQYRQFQCNPLCNCVYEELGGEGEQKDETEEKAPANSVSMIHLDE